MECIYCSISLHDRPCIFVDTEPHCFKCAKQSEKDSIEFAKQKYEKELKIYKERSAAFKKRYPNFNSEMPFLDGSDVLVGIVGWLIFPVIGTIVGILVWQAIRKFFWRREQDKLNKEFEAKNPMPISPGPPDIDLELDESRFQESVTEKNYRKRILLRDDYTCQNCEEQKDESELEVHHIQMRSKGGTDHPTNLVALCLHCHDRERWFEHKRMFPTTFKSTRYT